MTREERRPEENPNKGNTRHSEASRRRSRRIPSGYRPGCCPDKILRCAQDDVVERAQNGKRGKPVILRLAASEPKNPFETCISIVKRGLTVIFGLDPEIPSGAVHFSRSKIHQRVVSILDCPVKPDNDGSGVKRHSEARRRRCRRIPSSYQPGCWPNGILRCAQDDESPLPSFPTPIGNPIRPPQA